MALNPKTVLDIMALHASDLREEMTRTRGDNSQTTEDGIHAMLEVHHDTERLLNVAYDHEYALGLAFIDLDNNSNEGLQITDTEQPDPNTNITTAPSTSPSTSPIIEPCTIEDNTTEDEDTTEDENTTKEDNTAEADKEIDASTSERQCDHDKHCTNTAKSDKNTIESKCTICDDTKEITKLLLTTCGHLICIVCITTMVEYAIAQESHHPPNCCPDEPINMDQVRPLLPTDLWNAFEAKKKEYETANRVYCSNNNCARFICAATTRKEAATCQACQKETCTACKAADHEDACAPDAATEKVLELADRLGWKRCFNCQGMVELLHGCDHITCSCGAEFCYNCGAEWKTCDCDVWDMNRLMGQQVPDPAAAVLLADHRRLMRGICIHDWQRRNGRHACDACGDTMYRFIWNCENCQNAICAACRDAGL